MEIDLIFKIAAIGIIVGVCYLLFYAVMILAVIALIAGIACG